MKDSLAQYRLRKVAIEMKRFTVADLVAGTGLNRESVQVFLHRLEKKDLRTIEKENLPSSGPGRPIVRYTLTSKGIAVLESEVAPIMREFSESELMEVSPPSYVVSKFSEPRRVWGARPGERKIRVAVGNAEAISILGPLFRATEDPCPVILLGAGSSFRSGVPTAADAVKQMARLVYAERELRNTRPPERVKPSEWESWLQSFDWFIPG